METTAAFTGLACVDCGATFDAATATHRCPDCDGILDPAYDYDRIDLTPSQLADRPFESMWRYAELLPFAPETAVSLGEGATPLVECPALADAMGVGLVGMHKAAREARELGWTDGLAPLYAAQAAGCAPIVDAYEAGADRHEPVPDDEVATACNGIAISDPGASLLVLDAIRESDGGAVATTDQEILDAAIEVARSEGLEVGATCAAAVSGAFALAESGEFGADDTVVILNTGAGNKDADALRAHLGEREAASTERDDA
jgi:threonine synthase